MCTPPFYLSLPPTCDMIIILHEPGAVNFYFHKQIPVSVRLYNLRTGMDIHDTFCLRTGMDIHDTFCN